MKIMMFSKTIAMMVLLQANLELKERMESALEREERARAELQDSKDQVKITMMADKYKKNVCWMISYQKYLPGGATGVPCA